VSPSQTIAPVFVAGRESKSIQIPISLTGANCKTAETVALVDCGASGCFVDTALVTRLGWQTTWFAVLRTAYNVDGTMNENGLIWLMVSLTLWIGDKDERHNFYVIQCGNEDIILGLPWLWEANPIIDWASGMVELPDAKPSRPLEDIVTQHNFKQYNGRCEDYVTAEWYEEWYNHQECVCRTTISTAQAAEKEREPIILPPEFADFADVFQKPEVPLPPHCPFDHTIELNDSFVPRRAKNYSLNPKEMEALKVFIDKNLKEGKILPSKSLQASPFFFVLKKDGMFHPCQDYWYVNSHTIKNAYPLPRISNLIDTLKHSCYFTKLDIWWGYNNIRIKETDQWKATFTTPYGLYEPMVMFFGQCNSPPMFQAFMNHIFADYLAEGWLIIYMDDHMCTRSIWRNTSRMFGWFSSVCVSTSSAWNWRNVSFAHPRQNTLGWLLAKVRSWWTPSN